MKKANSSVYFYQNEKLVIVQKNQTHRAFFWTESVPLAERGNDNADYVRPLATDEKGSILLAGDSKDKAMAYTAYGSTPDLVTQQGLLGFNREPFHSLAELYLLGIGYHRGFSPKLMRFISPDNASPFGIGSFNAYTYCACDPINSIDPTGHARHPLRWLKKKLGITAKKEAKTAAHNESIQNYNQAIAAVTIPSNREIKKLNDLDTLIKIKSDLHDSLINIPKITTISKKTAKHRDKYGPSISIDPESNTKLTNLKKAYSSVKNRIDDIEIANAMQEVRDFDRNKPTGVTIGVSNKQKREREDWM